jgi:hypothetical protein
VTGDVFEEHPFGLDFSDNAGNIGPKVPGIICPLALSCGAERLAWVSGKHGVDVPVVWSAVKGLEVVPDRCRGKVSGPLACDDRLPWVFLKLDPDPRVKVGFCKHEAKIEATGSGAKGQSVGWSGMNAHVTALASQMH